MHPGFPAFDLKIVSMGGDSVQVFCLFQVYKIVTHHIRYVFVAGDNVLPKKPGFVSSGLW